MPYTVAASDSSVNEDVECETMSAISSSFEPQESVEGWVLFATGIHEEAKEDDVRYHFEGSGRVTNLHLNIDRKTGYAKGYALIEYANKYEAEAAIAELKGSEILGRRIDLDWAYVSKKLTHCSKRLRLHHARNGICE